MMLMATKSITIVAVMVFIILFAAPSTIFAHSGRTNAEGCHNNRKSGDYHCHHSPRSLNRYKNKSGESSSQTESSGEFDNSGAYRNCDEARAAGAAPIKRGEPGYGSHGTEIMMV